MRFTFSFQTEGKFIPRAVPINNNNIYSEVQRVKLDFANNISKVICQMDCCNSKIPGHIKRVIGQINPSWSVLWNINNLSELQSVLNLFRCPMRNESGMFSPDARKLIFLHHKNYNISYCSSHWQFSAETSKTEYASKQKRLNTGNSLFSITGTIALAILLHPREGTPHSS